MRPRWQYCSLTSIPCRREFQSAVMRPRWQYFEPDSSCAVTTVSIRCHAAKVAVPCERPDDDHRVSIRCHAAKVAVLSAKMSAWSARWVSIRCHAAKVAVRMNPGDRVFFCVSIRCHAAKVAVRFVPHHDGGRNRFNPLSCGQGGSTLVTGFAFLVEFQSAVMRPRWQYAARTPMTCWSKVSIRCHAAKVAVRC